MIAVEHKFSGEIRAGETTLSEYSVKVTITDRRNLGKMADIFERQGRPELARKLRLARSFTMTVTPAEARELLKHC